MHAPTQTPSAQQNILIWGSTREGMSVQGNIAAIALLESGLQMLITKGSLDKNSMPPGFVRLLTEEEVRATPYSYLVYGLKDMFARVTDRGATSAEILRAGRKQNSAPLAGKQKPHWHKFTTGAFKSLP